MTKYSIKPRDLETKHGVAKLERDGFSRERIIEALHRHTEGATNQERTKIAEKLYDRSEK